MLRKQKYPSIIEKLEKEPIISEFDPQRFIMERLLTGEIKSTDDPDLNVIEENVAFQQVFKEAILPLLTKAQLHELNKILMIREMRKYPVAFRNKSLALLLLKAEISQELLSSEKNVIEDIRARQFAIAELKFQRSSLNEERETLEKCITEQTEEMNARFYELRYAHTPLLRDHFKTLYETLFSHHPVNEHTYMNVIMFNWYGIQLATGMPELTRALFQTYTSAVDKEEKEEKEADVKIDKSGDSILTREAHRELDVQTDIHLRRRLAVLEYYGRFRDETGVLQLVDKSDVEKIKQLFDESNRINFGTRESKKTLTDLLALKSDSERYAFLKDYLQTQQQSVAEGKGSQRLFTVIKKYYLEVKKISCQDFFHLTVPQEKPQFSGSTLRKMGTWG